MIRFADRYPLAFLAALAAVMAAVGWMLRDTTPPTHVEPVRAVVPATAAPAVAVPPSSTAAATVAGGALGDGDVEVSSTTVVVPVTVAPTGGCGEWRDLIATYFPADQVDNACRVVECESEFVPHVVSPTSDFGLFQLNTVHRSAFVAQFGSWDPAVFDPVANTAFASQLWRSSGWQPWTCARKEGIR